MKRNFLFICLIALMSAGLFAQQKPVVAVAPFDVIGNAVTSEKASEINDVFFVRLGNTRSVELVNRNIVNQVLKEHQFQAGDWSNESKTAEFAKALSADWIVQGNIRKSGTGLLIIVQFYDINTFKFEGGTDIRLANADEAYDKMDPLVASLIKTITDTGTRQPAVTTTRSTGKTYNVGDIGPGGGIVFYDKGAVSNGWRYLEAAPVETESRAQWGILNQDVPGTGKAIGSGKKNTQFIMEQLKSSKDSSRTAAQLCESIDFNGFSDWFLPSQNELDLMYKNLKKKKLGGFSNDSYWSSSHYDNKVDAWNVNFRNGGHKHNLKRDTYSVRAIRQF